MATPVTRKLFAAALLWLPAALALGQEAAVPDSFDLRRAQATVMELETDYRYMDPRLAEPLLELGRQLMLLGRHGEAHDNLDRAMQIVRVNEGLFTRNQLPYLKQKIENFAAWGDWNSAREQLQHLSWLYRRKSTRIDQRLVDDLLDLSIMHLRGVTEDGYGYQSYHFRRAVSANWMALAVAESLWSTHDRRLSPILYSLLGQYHRQAVALDRGGRTGYELRRVFPGEDGVRERSEMHRLYYFTGMRLLSRLHELHAGTEPADVEGQAMANLYRADWQVLFGRHGEALQSYQQAYQQLQEAGVEAQALAEFFGNPSLLPEPEFYPSIELALSARRADGPAPPRTGRSGQDHLLSFAEWAPAFPYVSPPSSLQSTPQPDSNFALFSFSLVGVTDIPKWISNRDSVAFSSVQDARLVASAAESPEAEQLLLQKLSWLRFRPKLADGLPQQAEATLRYQLAAELQH